MQSEACAVVQAIGCKAPLLLTESHCQDPIGTAADIHPDQPCDFMLPATHHMTVSIRSLVHASIDKCATTLADLGLHTCGNVPYTLTAKVRSCIP